MIPAPLWSESEIESDRQRAIDLFRASRLEEPPGAVERFEEYQGVVEDLYATIDRLVNLNLFSREARQARRELERERVT